ncbi:hypothetical protein GCM10011491_43960 [Brucella endophytica]|uniref:Uncharacterized protein n=1 Tax=Brucella endophytica TaxID=1963359 RepID=A0A916SQF5_9HYPH|nr:hypothetical protein GCM10011491_43960 [Brucella endophytica]
MIGVAIAQVGQVLEARDLLVCKRFTRDSRQDGDRPRRYEWLTELRNNKSTHDILTESG